MELSNKNPSSERSVETSVKSADVSIFDIFQFYCPTKTRFQIEHLQSWSFRQNVSNFLRPATIGFGQKTILDVKSTWILPHKVDSRN